jgi:hypothetical protein
MKSVKPNSSRDTFNIFTKSFLSSSSQYIIIFMNFYIKNKNTLTIMIKCFKSKKNYFSFSSVFSPESSSSHSLGISDSGASSGITSTLGLPARATTSSIGLVIVILSDTLISDTLILSSISFNRDKSTSIWSTKSLGKQFISISFCSSSNIAPSLTATDSQVKFR